MSRDFHDVLAERYTQRITPCYVKRERHGLCVRCFVAFNESTPGRKYRGTMGMCFYCSDCADWAQRKGFQPVPVN